MRLDGRQKTIAVTFHKTKTANYNFIDYIDDAWL